ncbi:hypothetical protein SAMN04488063_1036 [Halopelagius inordinatus]|uniref:Uncharacterized protein n=1 Tax=Halopelagius inordinatus TaxID=553467 RepID=A0A1I2N4U8_9EURY|nr:hypothetical protein [Halopelagius inordinatus]SFF98663.1 hypothetical protein SAMN04488063_1036 [Halopelagius inordinatus]
MLLIALPAGLVVGAVAAAAVYADATRRGLSTVTRLSWAGGAALVSLVGFLVPALFSDAFYRAYFVGVKASAVAVSPHEALAVSLAFGVVVSVLFVLLYGFGSRYGPVAGE